MPAPTIDEFFEYWRSLADEGLRVLGTALLFEYEHRQKPWVAQMLRIAAERDYKMARGKNNNVKDERVSDMPVFINCTMPTAEKTKVTKFAADSAKIWDLVEQLLLAGYKLSWSYDKSRGAYIASLTCKAADDTNFNRTLSAWSSGWYDALAAVMYKHYVYLSEDWAMALTVKSEDAFG